MSSLLVVVSSSSRLWIAATIRVCADGGANRLYDELPAIMGEEDPAEIRRKFAPHLITGDLDSLRPEVRDFYCNMGVPVVDLSHDQDSTDLEKSIMFVRNVDNWSKYESTKNVLNGMALGERIRPFDVLVALGAHGGRLDHILGNLSILHRYRDIPLVLCGDGNLTRLVPQGRAKILPDMNFEGPSCGLIPLGREAVATSKGLRWNLDKTKMCIGGLVSTSNLIDEEEVWVETDSDLVWTTQLKYD